MRVEELRGLSREELIERADALGVVRPAVLTQAELIDEIVSRTAPRKKRSAMRGWLGKARDLLAQMASKGLHLPDAAKLFRAPPEPLPKPPPPLPTVTLAEIYAAQGHLERALKVLDQVLDKEPGHRLASELRERLAGQIGGTRAAPGARARQTRIEPETPAEADEEAAAVAKAAKAGAEAKPEASAGAAGAGAAGAQAAGAQAAGAQAAGAQAAGAQAAGAEREAGERRGVAEADEVEPSATNDAAAVSGDVPASDDVVVVAVDARSAYVYWELRPVRFARARSEQPDGALVLRVLSVVGRAGSTLSEMHDIPVEGVTGDSFVRGLLPGSEVRLCVGWKAGGRLIVLAVAPELQMPRDYVLEAANGDDVDWREAALAGPGTPRSDAGAAVPRARLEAYLAVAAQKLPVPLAELTTAVRPRYVAVRDLGAPESDPYAAGASELYGTSPSGVAASELYSAASTPRA